MNRETEGKILAVGAGLLSLFCLAMLVVCTVALAKTGEMSYGLNMLTFFICGGVSLFWTARLWGESSE